ncbi:butyrophilin-like protein 2 isoform X1 [Astatotilapia calliptera]|uniref:butyrophilin-like protein 2 isoform X1 n=1 Tax=Astatotilapia calliptera TaxID=8154 RepID=UPI000E4217BD|nr:butyrophilin-like protein 2 isoform X1 [Astatotilapia calliptera]
MKMLLPLLLLVLVSQHALAPVVEVYEGEKSVLLPCEYSGFIPEENPTVLWTRNDLDPKSVHVRREETNDVTGQNQLYSGRTSMRPDALDSSDFSLTLRNPQMTDSGNYTCSIGNERAELKLTDVQLHVKDQQVEVKVEEGSDSVILPCKTKPNIPEATRVEWTRSDLGLMVVREYSNQSGQLMTQDEVYRDQTKMNEDPLRTGDLSLTLKHPTERDSGGYICTIYRDKDILRWKVMLQVNKPFPSWAKALLVLLLVVSGGLLFYFRHYFMSVIPVKVKVEDGETSVTLPFKTTKHLSGEIQVIWERYEPFQKAHVFTNGQNQYEEQHEVYEGRTVMNDKPLETGDLSLTLKYPTDADSGEYKCLVWRKGTFIRKKTVLLKVKVCQVQFKVGAESVRLPFITTENLPEDTKVEWKRKEPEPSLNVNVYKNGSDQHEEQHEVYKGRTVMNEKPLETGDLSLTLKQPTVADSGEYKCLVWRNGNLIRKKTVLLRVKG